MWHDDRQTNAIAGVQHLALPWQEPFAEDFGIFEGEDWGIRDAEPPRLTGFLALKSVSFLVDHFLTWDRTGDILPMSDGA